MTDPTKERLEGVDDPVAALKQNLGDAQDNLDTADDSEQAQIDKLENEVNGGSGSTPLVQNSDNHTQTTAQTDDTLASDNESGSHNNSVPDTAPVEPLEETT